MSQKEKIPNTASRFAENEYEATEKFKVLYPSTYILDVN